MTQTKLDSVQNRIARYLRQLPPHVRARKAAQLLEDALAQIDRMEAALLVAADHLPYHEPDHPDYEGSASDAGRKVRLALDPDCGCSECE